MLRNPLVNLRGRARVFRCDAMLRNPLVNLVSVSDKRPSSARSRRLAAAAVARLSSNPESGNAGNFASKQGSTRVKFVLQRKCMFGEHFKVIGAHPTLGEWDPAAAIALEWSDGHNWTTELEVPHGQLFEYKFVLQCRNGWIHWQPGPNRVFSTAKKSSSLVVFQEWDFDGACGTVDEACSVADEAAVEELESEEATEPQEISIGASSSLASEGSISSSSDSSEDEQEGMVDTDVPEPGAVEATSFFHEPEELLEEAGTVIEDHNELAMDALDIDPGIEESTNDLIQTIDAVDADPEVKESTSKDFMATASVIDVQVSQVHVEPDLRPTKLTVWEKDRHWFSKVISFIFKR